MYRQPAHAERRCGCADALRRAVDVSGDEVAAGVPKHVGSAANQLARCCETRLRHDTPESSGALPYFAFRSSALLRGAAPVAQRAATLAPPVACSSAASARCVANTLST